MEAICLKQLQALGLQYIDLYLMHTPVGYEYVSDSELLPRDSDNMLKTKWVHLAIIFIVILLTYLHFSDIDYIETYKAMEQLVKKGYVRSIGLSNFNSEQIQRILDNCEIKPVTNQVECTPFLNQRKLIAFCKERDIVVTAYSPLGRPNPAENTPEFFYSPKTKALADKYNKTRAQIVLRYLVR